MITKEQLSDIIINSEEINTLLAAIDDLIDLKLIIRDIVPDYNLNKGLRNKFISILRELQNKLDPIFAKYLESHTTKKQRKSKSPSKDKILKILESKDYILVSANSSKKILKDLGADPRTIISTGGPLTVEDYKTINPNLPDQALVNITRKCENLLDQIERKDWENADLFFIYDKDNIADRLILEKKALINERIGKEFKEIPVLSWDKLAE
ncbi:MAG: DUF2100 domain-containing protein [Candidatus Lokiarchaeota archaeon]|nr:DUF2100 domain-containing protein [Candidatus Lokiarchaeota archaeon]MBD3339183.1 DUF2100 domain-containing protein [Candidatus Lokiarchaeota archaeon]